MILLSAQHRTVPEIATLLGLSRATVRYWVEQFDARGPAGLYDEPRCGRPRKTMPEGKATLFRILAQELQQVATINLTMF
jgi:transposase